MNSAPPTRCPLGSDLTVEPRRGSRPPSDPRSWSCWRLQAAFSWECFGEKSADVARHAIEVTVEQELTSIKQLDLGTWCIVSKSPRLRAGPKIRSSRPHTAKSGTLLSLRYTWSLGYTEIADVVGGRPQLHQIVPSRETKAWSWCHVSGLTTVGSGTPRRYCHFNGIQSQGLANSSFCLWILVVPVLRTGFQNACSKPAS